MDLTYQVTVVICSLWKPSGVASARTKKCEAAFQISSKIVLCPIDPHNSRNSFLNVLKWTCLCFWLSWNSWTYLTCSEKSGSGLLRNSAMLRTVPFAQSPTTQTGTKASQSLLGKKKGWHSRCTWNVSGYVGNSEKSNFSPDFSSAAAAWLTSMWCGLCVRSWALSWWGLVCHLPASWWVRESWCINLAHICWQWSRVLSTERIYTPVFPVSPVQASPFGKTVVNRGAGKALLFVYCGILLGISKQQIWRKSSASRRQSSWHCSNANGHCRRTRRTHELFLLWTCSKSILLMWLRSLIVHKLFHCLCSSWQACLWELSLHSGIGFWDSIWFAVVEALLQVSYLQFCHWGKMCLFSSDLRKWSDWIWLLNYCFVFALSWLSHFHISSS